LRLCDGKERRKHFNEKENLGSLVIIYPGEKVRTEEFEKERGKCANGLLPLAKRDQ